MNRSETISKLAAALVKAQTDMGNAVKGASNPFFKSKYADLNAIREACLPGLNANGITVLQPTTVLDGKLYVETLLLHESGEFISGVYEVVVGKQNDPQSLGSAISYSRRYSLQSMVNIGADDDDGEKAHGRTVATKVETKASAPAPTNGTTISGGLTGGATDLTKGSSETVAPPKKTGFGVKAAPAQTSGSEDGWA
jgi:hypothetical protein